MPKGLYVHVPFCVSKCPYCDFHSYQDRFDCVKAYLSALKNEAEYYKKNFSPVFDTVFIGGGTPTVLNKENLEELLGIVSFITAGSSIAEFTVEANPETVNREKAAIIARFANRVSIGAQSFNPKLLAELGRVHSAKKTEEAAVFFRDEGIKNINLDMMFGIQGQNTADMLNVLRECVSLSPSHISFYMLTVYEGTPYHERYSGQLPSGDELLAKMYERGIKYLEDSGYDRYEISNFAKPGKECLHNINYWDSGEYIGIGSSASSFFQGKRYTNTEKPEEYIRLINSGKDPAVFSETIDNDKAVKEIIMLSLRMKRGVNTRLLKEKTGHDIYAVSGERVEYFISGGLLEKHGDYLRLTPSGMLVSNTVISGLF